MHEKDNAPGKARQTRRRGTESTRVYDVLRQEILSMSLKPTQRLDEAGLSKRFSCSRTPVREALFKLASESLVTALPNKSAMVTPLDFATVPAYFDALTLLQRVTMRLAAKFRTDADLIIIRRNQVAFDAALSAEDTFEMIETNRQFHVSIAEAGRNPYYTSFYARLLDEGRRLLHVYFFTYDKGPPTVFSREHGRIVDAVSKRDESLADRLASEHAAQVADRVRSYLDNRPGAAMPLDPPDAGGRNTLPSSSRRSDGDLSAETIDPGPA